MPIWEAWGSPTLRQCRSLRKKESEERAQVSLMYVTTRPSPHEAVLRARAWDSTCRPVRVSVRWLDLACVESGRSVLLAVSSLLARTGQHTGYPRRNTCWVKHHTADRGDTSSTPTLPQNATQAYHHHHRAGGTLNRGCNRLSPAMWCSDWPWALPGQILRTDRNNLPYLAVLSYCPTCGFKSIMKKSRSPP